MTELQLLGVEDGFHFLWIGRIRPNVSLEPSPCQCGEAFVTGHEPLKLPLYRQEANQVINRDKTENNKNTTCNKKPGCRGRAFGGKNPLGKLSCENAAASARGWGPIRFERRMSK